MAETNELLLGAYRDFNRRDLDAAIERMQPDVVWPNGWEGGYVHGREGVRDYWTRQWAVLDPHVDPVEIRTQADGAIAVTVHQVVRDREGKLLHDGLVRHVFRLQDGLIAGMEIEPAE